MMRHAQDIKKWNCQKCGKPATVLMEESIVAIIKSGVLKKLREEKEKEKEKKQ